MTNLSLRAYTDADLDAVAAVFTSSVHGLTEAEYDEEQRNAWAPRPHDLDHWRHRLGPLQTLVAVEDGALVGFISFELDGHIDLLYVAPEYARRGVASQLYGSAEEQLFCEGLAELFTEASSVARPFFERLGFRVIEEQSASLGGVTLRRYVMRKRLAVSS